MIARPVAMLLLVAALAGAAEPVELKEQPFDIVSTKDGRTLEGTLVEQRTDGTLIFKVRGSKDDITIPAGTHHGVLFRRTAAQVVAEAGKAAIAAKDQRRVIEVLRWALEHDADAAALAQAVLWLKQQPGDRDALAIAVPLWKAKKDWAALEAAARAGLAADRNWSEGDELVVESLAALGRNGELDGYAREWLARNPTALRANLICGASFESAGDVRAARECYRKAWDLHKHPLGGLGLARTSLSTGQYADGLRTAQALIEQKQSLPEARAYAGAAAAALGDLATAKALLQGFAPDAVPAVAAQAGSYALGLVAFREGRHGEAAKHWQTVPTPSAQLALAIAQRREFSGAERLPPEQRAAAQLLGACVRLENRQAAKALTLIDQHQDGRQGFLHRIAQVLESGGSAESVRALAAVRTAEANRWQLYGHLIAGRYDEADALARSLPASDGYAMCCRVFLAAARGDPEGARMLYEGSGGLPGAPAEYVRRLKELYDTADDQQVSEPFDWPAGETLSTGWEALIGGTGIAVRADGGKLVMEGTQAAEAADPVTRAVTTVPGARFRLARLAIDIGALGGGTAGLELLEGARKNGVAIAAIGGNPKLQWRQLTAGRWSEWRELPYAVEGTTAVMALDFSGGRIFAADPADPMRRTQLSDVLARAQGEWSLGLFGTAAPGTAWKAGFDDLRWRLKPER
jgi:hypothetical protein